jgi:HEAT repeats
VDGLNVYACRPPYSKSDDRTPRNVSLAVQCLGEVHNLNAIHMEATELLRVIIELLERSIGIQDSSRDELLQEELVPAIQAVATAWPNRELYEHWFRQVGAFYTQVPIANVTAQIAGILLSNSPALHEMLDRLARTGDDYRKRAAAIAGIVVGWGATPATQALLRNRALRDKHRLVRQAAMIALRDLWPTDVETLSLISELAKDNAKDVRVAALLALRDGWLGDRKVLELQCDIGFKDSDPDVKEAVHQGLRIDPAARGFLTNLSTNHVDINTRRKAITLLAEVWPRDTETLILLRAMASDPNWRVRQTVITVLGNTRAGDPEIFTFYTLVLAIGSAA